MVLWTKPWRKSGGGLAQVGAISEPQKKVKRNEIVWRAAPEARGKDHYRIVWPSPWDKQKPDWRLSWELVWFLSRHDNLRDRALPQQSGRDLVREDATSNEKPSTTLDFIERLNVLDIGTLDDTVPDRATPSGNEAAGARTQDLRIKSPLLYRLSYSLESVSI